jgi:murein L,D-transpeptidase YafK
VVRAGAKRLALLAALALALPAAAPAPAAAEGAPYLRADKVLVIKSDRRLRLMRGRAVLYEFPISLGWNPVGHKLYEGDGRTPEGRYTLDYFNTQSAFYRSIHISYPNGVDRLRAARRGDRVGGNIVIHGLPNGAAWIGKFQAGTDWTSGCIAVSNDAMDVIWLSVGPGTPIEIRP